MCRKVQDAWRLTLHECWLEGIFAHERFDTQLRSDFLPLFATPFEPIEAQAGLFQRAVLRTCKSRNATE